MRVRALSLTLLALSLIALGACARPAEPTIAAQPAAAEPAPAAPAPASRTAAVYVAVLERYLTSSDHSFGEGHRFPGVYVLDAARPDAADPIRQLDDKGQQAIDVTTQREINTELGSAGPVTFVATRESVVHSDGGCDQVKDGGILITLGTFAATGERVEVGLNGYVACLGATWLTYVVERSANGWTVTGKTGPSAIA